MEKYVIIGNGAAAAGTIEGIREHDRYGSITVVSEEIYPVYCRPLISYYLEGKSELKNIWYRCDSFYEDNRCSVLYGVTATEIDYEDKKLLLSNGESVAFTMLCIATGSYPFVPATKGLSLVDKKFTFMSLSDCLSLEKSITSDMNVLILGAGLIGLKCAEGIYGRVKSITVCDLSDRILSSILDSDSACLVKRSIEAKGIEFVLSDCVEEFKKNQAVMRSGRNIDFDILISAVGVRANTALIAQLKGEVNRGIVVNDKMQTSLPGIYAAGDCTEGCDVSFGNKRILALLPNAYMQGHTAGVNMAGGESVFDKGMPMNSMGLFGTHIITAGTYTCDKESKVYTWSGDNEQKKFFVKDGLLKGYILVNSIDKAGVYTHLIRNCVPLNNVDFQLLMENPSLAGFSAEYRREIFGGVV